MNELTNIYAKKDRYSFECLGGKIHFKLYSGQMYLSLKDVTDLVKVDCEIYRDKIDNGVEKKYPIVFFEDDPGCNYVTLATLMRLLADMNSVLGRFKSDESKSEFTQRPYLINQLYLAFK